MPGGLIEKMNYFIKFLIIGIIFMVSLGITFGTTNTYAKTEVIEMDENLNKIETKTATFAMG